MSNDPTNQMQCFDVKTEVFFSSEGLHKISVSVCEALSAISVDSKFKSESFGVILGLGFEK